MRVALVVPRHLPNIRGGGEISSSLLAKAIKRYVDIEVLSFDGNKYKEGSKEVKVKRISVKHPYSKILKNIDVYRYLKDKIKDYDIFHTYNMDLLPAIGMLTRKYNIKSIATLNGIVFSPSMSTYFFHRYVNPKFYRNKIMIEYIKNIKHFTTICPYFKEKWIEDGIEENKITIIPNMIDPSFKVIENEKSDDIIRILFIGNYAKWRNLDILLNAYSKLEYQNIELIIAGSGWENTIKKYKVKNKITYLGGIPYSKIAEMYSKCDIFVYPTAEAKTTDRVLIEALQNGLAVITTGNEYYSPIIRNLKDGILIYPMNEKELLGKMQILIENEKLRREIANNGKKRVYEICSPEKIAKRYIEIYENLEGEK